MHRCRDASHCEMRVSTVVWISWTSRLSIPHQGIAVRSTPVLAKVAYASVQRACCIHSSQVASRLRVESCRLLFLRCCLQSAKLYKLLQYCIHLHTARRFCFPKQQNVNSVARITKYSYTFICCCVDRFRNYLHTLLTRNCKFRFPLCIRLALLTFVMKTCSFQLHISTQFLLGFPNTFLAKHCQFWEITALSLHDITVTGSKVL